MSSHRWRALREMVERWAKVAADIEHGYSFTFDDYLNDLDLRRSIDERLHELVDTRDESIPQSITVALAAADDGFRRATVVSDANVWGVENERESGWSVQREWYYYRMPGRLPEGW